MKPEEKERELAWLRSRRAARLNVSIDELAYHEAGLEPRFLTGAQRRAARQGITVESVLAAELESLRASTYPGPDCLEPDEVEKYLAGTLADTRLQHIAACNDCARLLGALVPSKEELKQFLQEVRKSTQDRVLGESPLVGAPRLMVARRRRYAFAADMILAAMPYIAAMGAVFLALRVGALGVSASQPWDPLLAAALAVTLAVTVAWKLAQRSPATARAWRSARGALAGGVLVAGFAVGGFLKWRTDRLDDSLSLAQYELQDLALASLSTRHNEGRFLENSIRTSRVTVRSARASRNRMVYEAAASGVPGVLVTELGPDSGYLLWQKGDERDIRARFVVGRVARTDLGGILVVDSSGAGRYLLASKWSASVVRPGSYVAAAFDPSTNAAVRIQELRPRQ